MSKIFRAITYGVAYCFTRYMYFAIPTIWYWLPVISLGYYFSEKEVA